MTDIEIFDVWSDAAVKHAGGAGLIAEFARAVERMTIARCAAVCTEKSAFYASHGWRTRSDTAGDCAKALHSLKAQP